MKRSQSPNQKIKPKNTLSQRELDKKSNKNIIATQSSSEKPQQLKFENQHNNLIMANPNRFKYTSNLKQGYSGYKGVVLTVHSVQGDFCIQRHIRVVCFIEIENENSQGLQKESNSNQSLNDINHQQNYQKLDGIFQENSDEYNQRLYAVATHGFNVRPQIMTLNQQKFLEKQEVDDLLSEAYQEGVQFEGQFQCNIDFQAVRMKLNKTKQKIQANFFFISLKPNTIPTVGHLISYQLLNDEYDVQGYAVYDLTDEWGNLNLCENQSLPLSIQQSVDQQIKQQEIPKSKISFSFQKPKPDQPTSYSFETASNLHLDKYKQRVNQIVTQRTQQLIQQQQQQNQSIFNLRIRFNDQGIIRGRQAAHNTGNVQLQRNRQDYAQQNQENQSNYTLSRNINDTDSSFDLSMQSTQNAFRSTNHTDMYPNFNSRPQTSNSSQRTNIFNDQLEFQEFD
eukprot:403339246